MSPVIMELKGSPYVRGLQFGSARKIEIKSFFSSWFGSLREAGVHDPLRYLRSMLSETQFLAAIEIYAPDLQIEIEGIAEGTGIDTELIMAAQLMDEEWAYRPIGNIRNEDRLKCTTLAITGADGSVFIGQNMDLGTYTSGHQLMLRVKSDRKHCGALIFSLGPMIGLMGVNSRKVAVCVNALPQLEAGQSGLPVAFVIRKLLQSNNVYEAASLVRDLPHASGQHYLIASPEAVFSFEASHREVNECRVVNGRLFHTNHPLGPVAGAPLQPPQQANTEARLNCLFARLGCSDPDLSMIMATLSSTDDPRHPVRRSPPARQTDDAFDRNIAFTTGSMITRLASSEQVSSWVTCGPPDRDQYSRVWLDAGRTEAHLERLGFFD